MINNFFFSRLSGASSHCEWMSGAGKKRWENYKPQEVMKDERKKRSPRYRTLKNNLLLPSLKANAGNEKYKYQKHFTGKKK